MLLKKGHLHTLCGGFKDCIVNLPPYSLDVPSLVRLYQASSLEGPQLDLKCEIDCCRVSTTCSVSWYFEGEEIDTRDSRFSISTEDEGLVHVLSVANPGVRDLGRYFCVLRSPLRDAPDKETVTITYPGVYHGLWM